MAPLLSSNDRAGNHASTKPMIKDAPIVLSPTKARMELELPPRHSSGFNGSAHTPNFELHSNPLDDERSSSAATPRPGKMSILPKIDISSAQMVKRKSINEGSKRPTSPHVTIAAPISTRNNQTSPGYDRRSSLPASARDDLIFSTARSSYRAPVRQTSLGKGSSSHYRDTQSGRDSPTSVAAVASYNGGRPDSASAFNRRHVASPEGSSDIQYAAYPTFNDDADLDNDDEQFKGHGTRRQSSIPSGRWTPTILSGIIRKAASPVHSFHTPMMKQISSRVSTSIDNNEQYHSSTQGRKTPSKYRPAEDLDNSRVGAILQQPESQYSIQHAPSNQGSHPLSHAHSLSNSTASNSSHSTQLHPSPTLPSHSRHTSVHTISSLTGPLQVSPILATSSTSTAASSPLIVPQARRGAINLRPVSQSRKVAAIARRKKAAAIEAARSRRPLHHQIIQSISLVIKAIRCPLETAQSCQAHIEETISSIDHSFRDPKTGQRVWRPTWFGAYIPLIIWLVVSLSSTITVLIWHTQVFRALDRLSAYLQELGLAGRVLLGSLIFITTFPPLPLYSTLIILCGFSFGLVQGFIISYIAALSGAIIVFLLSRSLLKGWMVELLNKSGGLKRVVRAIEKRPKLLFLVRLAPYPYNLMNTLLASSPTLTLRTYTICTALALPKLLVHCALGTSIKNFAAYNGAGADLQTPVSSGESMSGLVSPLLGSDSNLNDASASATAERIKQIAGFLGVGLCVGIFLYLFSVARRAVDEELDDDEEMMEEYDLMLSDDGEDEDLDAGLGSELDEDSINIARGSSESAKDSSCASLQDSTLGSISNMNITKVSDRVNGSEVTLVDGPLRNTDPHYRQQQSFSQIIPNEGLLSDGKSPNFIATPRNFFDSDSNPYLSSHFKNVSNKNRNHPRHAESHTSLADSIVEMEKHAVEMEKESSSPFFYAQSQKDLTGTPYSD